MKKTKLFGLRRDVVLFSMFLCSLLLMSSVSAQNRITGKIVDKKNEVVVGATILNKGTTTGTITDVDGNFSLEVPDKNGTIIVSSIGYVNQEISLAGRSHFNIILEEDIQGLDEVVVVGYGTQKKVSVTGSISQVDGKALEKAPSDNISNMLAGRLPGLVTKQNSGLPGEGSSILIRGYATTGENKPVYIVDGVQRDILGSLDPSEVETITVLKDAASAAIYGVQGASGVILITTKRGTKSDKPMITYKGSVSFSENANFPDFLNGVDYAYYHNLARELDGLEPLYTKSIVEKIKNGDPDGIYGNTNWFNELFSGNGLTQNHNVSLAGGNDRVKYFVMAGASDQKGIVKNVDYSRYNVRANVDAKVTDNLTMYFDLSGSREEKARPRIGVGPNDYMSVFYQAGKMIPIIPMEYNGLPTATSIAAGNVNPIAAINQSGYNNTDVNRFSTTLRLKYDAPFLKGLSAQFLGAYDRDFTTSKIWSNPYDVMVFRDGAYTKAKATANQSSSLTEAYNQNYKLALQPSLEFNRTFGKHGIQAQMVYDQLETRYNRMQAGKRNYNLVDLPELDLGSKDEVTPGSVTGNSDRFARIGVVGRINYSYDDKYLVQLLTRADASVRFAKDNRWGYFPAISLGWRMSEESFIRDNYSFVDNLKLRASYGVTGNDRIGDWRYMRTILFTYDSPDKKEIANLPYVIGGVPVQALETGSVPSYDITWEKSRTINGGFEASLWRGLLGAEFDYFYKYTWDILQSVSGSVPPSLGGNVPSIMNQGRVDARGFELTLSHRRSINNDFNYGISANLSWQKSRILQLEESVNIPDYQKKVGHSVGTMLGFVADGLYKDEADIKNSPYFKDVKPGDIKYKDLNGDGKITYEHDRTVISEGNMPKYNYGLNLDAQYKWFDVNVLFQGAADFDIALQGLYESGVESTTGFTKPFAAGGNSPYFLIENSWTPDNLNAEFPRLTTSTVAQNSYASSFWLRDGSYLRLKNVQVGFNMPKHWLVKTGLESVRLYVSGSNLATFSKLNDYGIDPEYPSVSDGYYPQQKTYSFGLNVTL